MVCSYVRGSDSALAVGPCRINPNVQKGTFELQKPKQNFSGCTPNEPKQSKFKKSLKLTAQSKTFYQSHYNDKYTHQRGFINQTTP